MSDAPRDPRGSDPVKTPPPTPLAPTPPGAPVLPIVKPVTQLTPEEQMALFEQELKETDWGHQPC